MNTHALDRGASQGKNIIKNVDKKLIYRNSRSGKVKMSKEKPSVQVFTLRTYFYFNAVKFKLFYLFIYMYLIIFI